MIIFSKNGSSDGFIEDKPHVNEPTTSQEHQQEKHLNPETPVDPSKTNEPRKVEKKPSTETPGNCYW